MPFYLTSYAMGGHTYGEYIEAEDAADARTIALVRGLGEKIELESGKIGLPNLLARHIRKKNWPAALHAASQLCHIGMAAGALTARECLGDTGLVHEIVHLLCDIDEEDEPKVRKARERHVRDLAREFEYRVPGYPRSFTGLPGVTVRIRDKIDQDATEGYANGRA